MTEKNLLTWEQKRGTRRGRRTKEQPVIDKATIKDSKARLTNLIMRWIDYRKACDMVSHIWIDGCLKMSKPDKTIRQMMRSCMETWRTTLKCN